MYNGASAPESEGKTMRPIMWTLVTTILTLLAANASAQNDAGVRPADPLVQITQCINGACTVRWVTQAESDRIMREARQRADDAMSRARQRADDAMSRARHRADDAMSRARHRADDAMSRARHRADDAMREPEELVLPPVIEEQVQEVGREYRVKIAQAHPDHHEALMAEAEDKIRAIIAQWKRDTAPTPPAPSTTCPPAPPSNP